MEFKNMGAAPDTRRPHGQRERELIASASKDKTIRLWDPAKGLLQELKGHNGCVNAVRFSPNGQLLASASDDKTVRLWDTKTGKLFQEFEGHRFSTTDILFSPGGHVLASVSYDKGGLWMEKQLEGTGVRPTSSYSPLKTQNWLHHHDGTYGKGWTLIA
jgi:WD40 repeat protein